MTGVAGAGESGGAAAGERGAVAASALPVVVTCSRGLEEVVARELDTLGFARVEAGRGMVRARGDATDVLRANLWLRAATRVLLPVAEGAVDGREALYRLARGVAWEDRIGRGQSLAVAVAGGSRAFASSAFAALTVKDAIVDQLRERWGSRPDVDRADPDLRVHLHLAEPLTTLSLDSTGEPLAHRGYRPRGGPAPLAESLAAGILLLAGYDGSQPFLDPMCGTGTVAIEAALIATSRAPGLSRRFACERWLGHDAGRMAELRGAARAAVTAARAPLRARDIDPRAVAATARNARAAGVSEIVAVEVGDLRTLAGIAAGSVVVTNPPYGRRIGVGEDLGALYGELGDVLKREAVDSSAWLLVGDLELAKRIGLRPRRRIVLFNGPIECRLLGFELFTGSAASRRTAATS